MSDPGRRTGRPRPEQAISVEERKHKQHFDYATWREREKDMRLIFIVESRMNGVTKGAVRSPDS